MAGKQLSYTAAEIDAKLDTVDQKYTLEEKTKLAGLSNYDDTDIRAGLETVINRGSKNRLKITGTTTSTNGVDFTVNSDGSITAYGKATGGNAWFRVADPFSFVSGTILSGCPAGGTLASSYVLAAYSSGGTRIASDIGNGVEINDTLTGYISLGVYNGTEVDLTFYPMICSAEEYEISETYEPYAPTNRELYEMILALQSGRSVQLSVQRTSSSEDGEGR